MAIKPISFEDIGDLKTPTPEGIEPISLDDLFGEKPVEPTPEPTPEPSAPIFKPAPSPFTAEGMRRLETDPFITRQMADQFSETLSGYESLRHQPTQMLKGAGEFVTAIPGFMLGVLTAAQRMSKNLLDQVVVGQTFDLEEMYNVASEGMQEGFKYFDPAQKLIFDEPTPESQLVGATVMAPLNALHMLGNAVAEWPRFKDSPNIRGAAKFTGDIGGIAAMGMIIRGPRAEVAKRMETVTRKAAEIKVKEELAEQIPDEAIKIAQKRVLEVETQQLELEAAKVKESLDVETPIKEDLKAKGREVKEIKKVEIVQKPSVPAVEPKPVEVMPETKVDVYHRNVSVPAVRSALEVGDIADARAIYNSTMLEKSELWGEKIRSEIDQLEAKGLKPSEASIEQSKAELREAVEREIEKPGAITENDIRILAGRVGDNRILDALKLDTPEKRIKRLDELTREPRKSRRVKIAPELPEIPEVIKEKASGMAGIEAPTDIMPLRVPPELEVPEGRVKIIVEDHPAVIELDRQTGVDIPGLEGERSPFFQNTEETAVYRKLYEERAKAVSEDPELFTQKMINDTNRWMHGEEVDINAVRDQLSTLAARADELRMDFLDPADHLMWKDTVSDAAEWARRVEPLRLEIEQRPIKPEEIPSEIEADVDIEFESRDVDKGTVTYRVTSGKHKGKVIELDLSKLEKKRGPKLYSGIPLDEAGKAIVEGARRFMKAYDKATGIKKFNPLDAARLLNQEFKRNFVDRSGNIRLDLLDKLGTKGYEIVQKMYLTKGSNSLAANMLQQMRKEVYSGLSKSEKAILDKLILAERMADIGKYKTPKEFAFPEGQTPGESVTYMELFPELEGLDPRRAQVLRDRVRAHFEWMKKPLQDMLDAELISQEEFNNLISHNYRKIKLVDIYDRQYQAKLGKRKRTVHDSGVEALAKGRTTDIYEPSSEIMALEVFNRAYGRILNNEANKSLLGLARNDPKNPFVRVREGKQGIPSGWSRIFVFEKGERKPIYLSPEMSKEWIVSNPEVSYRTGQFLRYASASPVLRTFATGINWGFALANLPRDVMHTWFTARMFDGKEWKNVYSNQLPIFLPEIGMDLARTFTDAATKGKRYQNYIKEGGGMEFLVHQGRPFARGRRLEGPFDKFIDYMGYFGETSEIMTRLAIRDRVIRRRAKESGISFEEARKVKEITKEATFAARDYMDFGQGGGIAKAADNALPYLNASIQGTRGLWRAAVDNPRRFAYKVAQLGAVTTLVYAAAKENAPKTMENLAGSEVMENNLCIPLGDGFGFEDEKGQMRYPYLKVPLDPGQKFFKTFFEAAYDKGMGYDVDIDRVTGALKEFSPVGISNLPPTFSGTVGYVANKDFWRNEDIWKKTDPFKFPRSEEEFIPGRTSQAFIDIGKATGLSPERTQFAVEELTTGGTLWSYMMGKGYEKLFADVPDEKKEQHIAMTLSQIPVVKRFFGVTNPYSKYASKIEEGEEKDTMERWIQNRELDRLVEGHLFEDSVERKEIFKYIRTFKDKTIRDRLMERFDYQYAIKDLPERSFWLRLKGLNVKPRAEVYHDRWVSANEEERKQLTTEVGKIGAAGKVITDGFWDEFNRLRSESSP